jgi:hypothetical protein
MHLLAPHRRRRISWAAWDRRDNLYIDNDLQGRFGAGAKRHAARSWLMCF